MLGKVMHYSSGSQPWSLRHPDTAHFNDNNIIIIIHFIYRSLTWTQGHLSTPPFSDTPISGLGVSTNELMTWIRCVWLRRHAKHAVLGVPQGPGLGTTALQYCVILLTYFLCKVMCYGTFALLFRNLAWPNFSLFRNKTKKIYLSKVIFAH